MKKILFGLCAFAMFAGTASAASLTNKSYSTAKAAAKAGAAYTFSKAVGGGRFHSSDMKILKVIDGTGPSQKFRVGTLGGSRSKIVTVKKDAPGKYRAFIPNRYVYTPVSTGRNP